MSDRPTVHIVDDEAAIRRSAGFLLKKSGYRVEAWPSGVEFLKDVRSAAEGCILLDIRMPVMDGLDVQQALIDQGVTMPIVLLTGHADVGIAVRAMKAGAVDFVEKPFDIAVLLDAIEAAFARLDDKERYAASAQEAALVIASLTPRERDVLEGLARGLPNKTIAYDLGISARTVEVHRANLMAKLGVRSFPDALRIAFAAGLGIYPN
ncbi:response regulator transcription factor [Sphingobium sp. YR768]|uniref:response regulator transcription factor n=1 Tax=Sphingobium sp. YR768 TaxID=1884365 RepID=UPI0008C968EF|nr:response regulator [Sphingobium sp. YR768]SEQ98785.1 two component transcriptional regulator, LuxR family [Sphingobium sp. YR768]